MPSTPGARIYNNERS